MNPSIDDRLSSIVRAMTDIILPALPANAGLAREQLQLCIGHLGILRAQIERADAYESEALADARHLAVDLLEAGAGDAIFDALHQQVATVTNSPRDDRERINHGICDLLAMPAVKENAPLRRHLASLVIAHEQARAAKDRQWFAPMGFDRDYAS